MRKLNCALLSVLLTTTFLAGSRESALESRETTSESQLPTTSLKQLSPGNNLFERDPDPPRRETAGGTRAWEDLFERYPSDPPKTETAGGSRNIDPREPPRPETPGGTRNGSNFCAIAPGGRGKTMEIWSDRPLFLWKGMVVGEIEVRLHGSDEVLWNQTVRAADSSAIYEGEPLQPGQTYDWVLLDSYSITIESRTFQVMTKKERDAIAADLTRLETQLKQSGADPEKIALALANYFAERQLWSDVLQEAYSVKNPSAALGRFVKTMPDKVCGLKPN